MEIAHKEEALRKARLLQRIIFVSALVSVIIAIVFGYTIAIKISDPILNLAEAVKEVGQGNLDIKIQAQSSDEIGALVHSFNTMNNQLKESQTQLIQAAKLASLGEIATGIAHELNNPLGIINAEADMSLILMERNEHHSLKESLTSIKSQIKRASKIITHINEFGRDSKLDQKEEADINQIITLLLQLYAGEFKNKKIVLQTQMGTGLPPISCKKSEIEQVLINLINNAMSAMEEVSEKKLSIRSLLRGTSVVVEVQDSGSGIPKEIQGNIFNPFFTTKSTGKGTGLGLSISYKIIQNHQGSIQVLSEGRGSTFIIELPKVQNT